jgi:hypothetical protein
MNQLTSQPPLVDHFFVLLMNNSEISAAHRKKAAKRNGSRKRCFPISEFTKQKLCHCLWQKTRMAATAEAQKSFLTEVGFGETPSPPPLLPVKTKIGLKVRLSPHVLRNTYLSAK